ncbi:hypothetical protein VaNZ11_000071 [Volvox africanus]|uniref:Uncharacterized protein n=1 Tax=Volvox africanus TaxID=51714 RepID=A0ABQ5RN57_9CHLO|nr:hypothetical protein VaNZ11_000071 [Volvox africanus]
MDAADRAYVTPPPERLLFSVSPVLGQSALAEARHMQYPAHLPTMQSTAGQAGNQATHQVTRRVAGVGARCIAGVSSGQDSCVGWSRDLLLRQAALLPAISSVEGLKGSAQFQEYIRNTPRGLLVAKQCQDKIETYQRLRQLDPDAFRQLFSRDDIQVCDLSVLSITYLLIC